MKQILKTNPYRTILNWIIENGVSNYKPYHSLRHLLNVFKYSIEGSESEQLPRDLKLPLYVAALVHDLDHAGASDDTVNINVSIDTFYELLEQTKLPFTNWQINLVIDYIKATRYPYDYPKREDLLIAHKIIRDADLMGMYEPNYLTDVYLGLYEELSKDNPLEFLEEQINFIDSIDWHTTWARNKWNTNKIEVASTLADLKILLS
jgi:hypothetical protein